MAKKAASKKKTSKQSKLQNLVYKIKSSRKASVSVILVLVIAFSSVGYYLTNRSNAAAITATQCRNNGGVWLDLTGNGIDHGPCWSTPGAYLVNYGVGKVGDGIDHIPLTGDNPQTGNNQSEPFNYPNYIIVVSGNWQACGTTSCTSRTDPFTHTHSTPYRTSGGGEGHLHGGAYNLCAYDYYWYNSSGRHFAKLCSEPGIYLRRI